MKISAHTRSRRIGEVTNGTATAHLQIDVGGTIVTSSITNAAVNLELAAGRFQSLRWRQRCSQRAERDHGKRDEPETGGEQRHEHQHRREGPHRDGPRTIAVPASQ